MRILPLLLLSAVLPPGARAQHVTGTIFEEGTRAPVAGADIRLFDDDGRMRASGVSDSAGHFRLTAPNPGGFTLHVRHIAFAELVTEPINIGRNETVHLELTLGRTVIPLEPVLVTARTTDLSKMAGFNERLRSHTFGRFITREEIDRRSASRTTDLLRTIPGVQIRGIRAPRGRIASERGLVLMRAGSARSCEPALYIDGVRVRQSPEATIDDMLAPDLLEGVEVYTSTSGAPAQYMDPAACGVVLFWTREGEPGAKFSWKRLLVGAGALVGLILIVR